MTGLILFGAGVSAFSPGITPTRPPLGNKLFDSLAEKDPFFKKIEDKLAQEFRNNFERGMEIFDKSRNIDIGLFIRKMASFFLDFSSTKSESSYYYILKLMKDNRIKSNLSTLNYDLVLDEDLDAIGGIRGCISSDYIAKIHGSPNIWPDMIGEDVRITAINCGTNVESPTRKFTKVKSKSLCKTEGFLAPSMSLYAVGKKVYYCNNHIKNRLNNFSTTHQVLSGSLSPAYI